MLVSWPKFEITSSFFNMKVSYGLHYQGSSFFSYLCVCVLISLVLSHSCFSTSHQCILQTSSLTFISCQKWSDLVTHPALKAASAMFFLPFCSSPGQAHCPLSVHLKKGGYSLHHTSHHSSKSRHLQSLTCDNFIRKTVVTDFRQKLWKKIILLLLLLLLLILLWL